MKQNIDLLLFIRRKDVSQIIYAIIVFIIDKYDIVNPSIKDLSQVGYFIHNKN